MLILCISFEEYPYSLWSSSKILFCNFICLLSDDAFFNWNWAGACWGSLGRTRIDDGQVHKL